MSRQTINLNSGLYRYMLSNTLREDDIAQALRERTAAMAESNMQISPEQGQLMYLLAKLVGCRNAIEVGVFTGYSTLCVARALPAAGRLIACDVSEDWTSVGREYWQQAQVDRKIDLRIAPALDTLQQLIEKGQTRLFDFAFIDADKSNYDNYYEACLKLVRANGLIAIDNTLWAGAVADPEADDEDTQAIRALNRKIHQDGRVDQILLPVGDGLTLVRPR